MDFIKYFRKNGKAIIFIILFGFSLYATYMFLTVGQRGYDTVLVDLASRFLEWKVSLSIFNLPPRDISNYYNNFYVYFGPLSSLILLPFVFFFGKSVPQVSIGVGSMIISFIAVYGISKYFKFNRLDSLFLSLFFVFSTVMFASSVVNITAWQVEALGVPFVLLSIWAYFRKRHAFLIGVCIGLAVLTRFTLMGVVAFFFFELLQKRFSLRQYIILLIPVILAIGILGAYNQRRFHSFFETGYHYNISKGDLPIGANLTYGEISLMHLPGNLYSFLVMSPLPLKEEGSKGFLLEFPYMKADAWGVSIWFTSPLFLFLLTHFKKGTYTNSAGLTALILSLPVFLWYSIGFAQFGYRYALDFLPFLFLLLLPCLAPRLSRAALILIILGVLFNTIYSGSIFDIYPVFLIY